MSERLRKETFRSWFFPAMRGEIPGRTAVAPPAALEKRDKLRTKWLMEHPNTPKEAPMVSLSPAEKDGRKGFIVKKEIIYRPQKTEPKNI